MTKTIPETCDIWDTNYNSDNWEPEFMTICVAWQLRVTLDSIRTSCDVYGIWGRLNGWQKRYLVNKPKVKKSRFGEFFDYWAFGLPQTKWFKNQSRVLIIQINCFCEKYKSYWNYSGNFFWKWQACNVYRRPQKKFGQHFQC